MVPETEPGEVSLPFVRLAMRAKTISDVPLLIAPVGPLESRNVDEARIAKASLDIPGTLPN